MYYTPGGPRCKGAGKHPWPRPEPGPRENRRSVLQFEAEDEVVGVHRAVEEVVVRIPLGALALRDVLGLRDALEHLVGAGGALDLLHLRLLVARADVLQALADLDRGRVTSLHAGFARGRRRARSLGCVAAGVAGGRGRLRLRGV